MKIKQVTKFPLLLISLMFLVGATSLLLIGVGNYLGKIKTSDYCKFLYPSCIL